ncbi:MAG TPA: diguanylate cyclase [bacterium]
MSEKIRVLLVEDEAADAALLQDALGQAAGAPYDVEWVTRAEEAMEALGRGGVEVVLLDLFLPDSEGLETFVRVSSHAPETPVVVLTMCDDDAVAIEAVRRGAQDFIVKGRLDGATLSRAIRYAIERHRMQETLRGLSLLDELTGLYNRRGLMTLADHHFRLARRATRGLLLVFADLDGLKLINDRHGHPAGDCALRAVADSLREAFRSSDIVARIGGDEFAVLAVEARPDSAEMLLGRIEERLRLRNAGAGATYALSLSLGAARFDPAAPRTLEELMREADAALYARKRSREGRP